MLKALLKKQFLEINTFYFQDKKTGKRRSAAGTAGFIALFVFVFISLAASFAGIAALFANAFIPAGLDWLYFAMMGMISIFLSSLINMFIANTQLFNAKDNELLLAMPVPSSRILFVRMLGLYAWGLLYGAITFLPAVVIYWGVKPVSFAVVVLPVAVFLLNSLAILALSCIFGWIVALVASRLRNKSIITVLLAVVLIGVYYVAYFRLNALLRSAVENAYAIGRTISGCLFPFYHMGLAAGGSPLSLLIYAWLAIAFLVLVYLILDYSLIHIVTANRGVKKTAYMEQDIKQTGIKTALLKKELKHFASSPAYMLNTGLGMLILPALGIFALVRADAVRDLLLNFTSGLPESEDLAPIAVAAVGCLLLSMNCFTAPSVSLEGKSLWLLQSLPVEPSDVLLAKQRAHLYLNAAPAVIYTLALGIVIRAELLQVIFMLAFALAYTVLSAAAGLAINLKKPNLTWTNETVPIKQGMSVMLTLFGGWGVAVVFAVGGYLLRNVIGTDLYLLLFMLLLALAARFVNVWLKTKGAELFRHL